VRDFLLGPLFLRSASRYLGIVVRRLNVLLKRIYGQGYRKTYKSVHDGGRLRKRRVYRVPTAEEVERALADSDTAVVELAEEKRRRKA
jgi:hypothetical protein